MQILSSYPHSTLLIGSNSVLTPQGEETITFSTSPLVKFLREEDEKIAIEREEEVVDLEEIRKKICTA